MRYISNYSTGKMGIAIAEEAAKRGAEVTLVLGPVDRRPSHAGITIIDVESGKTKCLRHVKASSTMQT